MIIHLTKEQTRLSRRHLLTDDVFVIFAESLNGFYREGKTHLNPTEIYLSAKTFAEDILALPDVLEGIGYEMDDLLDEAEDENDAMFIIVVSAAVILAVSRTRKEVDAKEVIMKIFERWNDHPLFLTLLGRSAQKEEARWMEGKRINFLTCELEGMKTDGTTVEEAKNFMHEFIQQVCRYSNTTVELVLNPLRDVNEMFDGALSEEVSLLKRKLGVEKRINRTAAAPFVLVKENTGFILAKISEYQSGKSKPKDVIEPVRAAIDAGVIRRPTYDEYSDVTAFCTTSKSSFSQYTNPDNTPYYGEAYNKMVDSFR